MSTGLQRRMARLAVAAVSAMAVAASVTPVAFAADPTGGPSTTATGDALDVDAILASQDLDQPQWYRDNIPFLDTPDQAMDDVYYYRWSTYKRALRYTVPGSEYVSTEYDVPIGYSGNPYTALPDAAGYHLMDGRWAADQSFAGDYLDFYLRGAGVPGTTNYSEWIIDAAFERALVTGDMSGLQDRLPDLIALYDRWAGRRDVNFPLNGTGSGSTLYWQSPLADATEFTETSFKSSNSFAGGAGYRPTLNAYMYAAAQAISTLAADAGDTATASDFAARAGTIKTSVQNSLWDPQRQFFFQVYNQQDNSNGALKGTRTTWRELMGYAPFAYDLPDPQYASAWQWLTRPEYFGAQYGPTTLERFHDLEAEQATRNRANVFSSPTASNGSYVGQIDFADSAVTFAVDAPGAGTYPVRAFYANGTGANSTHLLYVNGSSTPITVTYPASPAWQTFSSSQYVTVDVPMQAGRNTLRFAKGNSFAELDRIATNPYFNFEAIPATPNRDDFNCCHWNGPTWPYQTSQVLNGLANQLQDYPAQPYVTAADYRELLADFTNLQFKNGEPYIAEAADGDTGAWIYDAENFSEHYNHSSYIDVVLSGLLGIQPQADDTLVLTPLVSPDWDYFAVQNLSYHGHKLSITWDRDGTHYGVGTGLTVRQDGAVIYSSPTLDNATIDVGERVTVPVVQDEFNILANPLTMEQDWLNRPVTQPFPRAFASYTNTVSNGRRCHSGQVCRTTTFDQPMRATDGWIRYDVIPDNRWTNAGSPNGTDFLGVDFGAVRPIQQLSIYTYDDGANVRTPAAFEAQYLDGSTWRAIPDQVTSPASPRANDVNTIEFPTLFTSQVRVVFTPQAGRFVGVTEMQSWYPESPVARIVSKNSGLELSASSSRLPYGALVTQEATTGAVNHTWSIVPAENGFYKIINEANGFVIGVRDASRSRGADGLLWVDSLTRDHLWSIVDAGNGYSKLVNANSGLVLGVDGASTAPGAKTVQWDDSGTDDHLWRIVATDSPSDYAVTNLAAGLELAGSGSAQGAAVTAAAAAGTTSQRWTLSPSPNATVQIVNQDSGLVLGVQGSDPAVVQTAAVDSPATRWQVVGFGDGYHRLVNVASNLALSVPTSAAPGAAVTQQPISAATTQRWQLTVDNEAQAAATVSAVVDPTAPDGAAGWYVRAPRVTVTASAGADAQYRFDDAGPWLEVDGPVVVAGQGAHTLQVRAVADGVAGPVTELPFKVDTVAPQVEATVEGRQVTVSASDATSGVALVEYQVDGGPWTGYTTPVTVDDDAHTVTVRANDVAGLVSEPVSVEVAASGLVPTVSLASRDTVSAAGWYAKAVQVTVTAPAGTTAQVRVDNGAWTAYTKPFAITGSGAHTVASRLVRSGSVLSGSETSTPVRVDTKVPVSSVTRTAATGTPRNPVSVVVTGKDTVSGLARVEYSVNGGTWATVTGPLVFDQVGDYTVRHRAVDLADNIGATGQVTVQIEANSPASVTASKTRVPAGGYVTLSMAGYDRYDTLTVTMGTTVLGSTVSNVSGTARVTVQIPVGTTPGAYPVTVTGSDGEPQAGTSLTVVAPTTRSRETLPL